MSPDRSQDVTIEPRGAADEDREGSVGEAGGHPGLTRLNEEADPTHGSTPTLQSLSGAAGSTSVQVSLVLKQHPCT